ncbi:acyltransferase [Lysobacter arseniciresistens ZS79]|uniref:Acyltransferase n=1 Tax=Lysobacter arseniciresistens ZS79 TaxID=913325 RepID=A0A0A0EVJ0_9GAMM|nr:acyltransferase [Lysobacter arseniciresistens]KGM54921.1 acyltransferase [Lysobacter arseniciresistens ZS79]
MSADWKQRPEGGGWFAIWLIRSIARYGGRAVARLLLYPITLYFLLVRGPERAASRDYLRRVLGRPAGLSDVARHIHAFAATILDRVFMLSGQMERFDVGIDGLEALHAQMDRGRGVLMFGSHLGSFEVLRVLARRRPDITVRVVLDKSHNPAMTQLLDALNPEIARTVIDAGQDGPSIVMAIREATEAGALVALLVDRTHPGQPSQPANFLGGTARFPVAPWLIASVLKVPVVLAFGLYRGGRRYDLAFEVFSEGIEMPRPQRAAMLAELVQRYATRLAHHARSAPYNWFNFYDFWQTDHANEHDHDRLPAGVAGRDRLAPRRGG